MLKRQGVAEDHKVIEANSIIFLFGHQLTYTKYKTAVIPWTIAQKNNKTTTKQHNEENEKIIFYEMEILVLFVYYLVIIFACILQEDRNSTRKGFRVEFASTCLKRNNLENNN